MRAEEALTVYRNAWTSGGLDAVEAAEVDDPEGLDDLTEGPRYEVLGWDALRLGRPGWAYICMRAATDELRGDGTPDEVRRAKAVAETLLQERFPHYEADADALRDIRTWAVARRRDLDRAGGAADGSRDDATTGLKHRWMFGLLNTSRYRTLRSDTLGRQLHLHPMDKVLLRVLAAMRGYPPPRLDELVEMVRDENEQSGGWVDRFDPRNPLFQWGLIRLADPGRSLRQQRVEIDESVLAWIEARDVWPLELGEIARPISTVLTGDEAAIFGAKAWTRMGRAFRRPTPVPVVIVADPVDAARDLATSWTAASNRLVLACDAPPTPFQARLLAREAHLRDAVVLATAEAGLSDALRRRCREAEVRVVIVTATADRPALRKAIDRAQEIRVPAPPADLRPNLWNEALEAQGLPPLHPRDLKARLGERQLHRVEIHAIAAHAADTAWLDDSTVGLDALVAALERVTAS